MARGNQRDKAREKAQKAQSGQVSWITPLQQYGGGGRIKSFTQKSKTDMSGAQQQKNKEDVAAVMRAKQAAGKLRRCPCANYADLVRS